jgi:hypothetical protein
MSTATQTWTILGGVAGLVALQTVWLTRSLCRVEQRLARIEARLARR